ncbi:MAG TPA: VOC family protein [Drouetiella sp.]
MQKVTPFLWFDEQAEEAVNFYTSIFKNSKIKQVSRYDRDSAKASGRAEGSVMVITFELDGQDYMALNGGPVFKFNPAISFMINCDTQEEIDRMWDELSDGGSIQGCGWVTDKFGISWQVVPKVFGTMMKDPDAAKTRRVMASLLQMQKLDIEALEKAFAGV